MSNEKDMANNARLTAGPPHVLYARTPNAGITIGAVSGSEPSPLALLAAGVAGMAARRALLDQRNNFLQARKKQTQPHHPPPT